MFASLWVMAIVTWSFVKGFWINSVLYYSVDFIQTILGFGSKQIANLDWIGCLHFLDLIS